MADLTDDLNLFDSVISGERNPDTTIPNPEPTPQEPVRDDAGKFAKATPTTEPTPELITQPAEPTDNKGVPVAAVQDERRKRQEAERRYDELERRFAELEAKANAPVQPAQQQPQQPITIWDNPDAWQRNSLAPIEQQMAEMREMMQEGQAQARHGADTVNAAKEASKALWGKPEGVVLYQEIAAAGGNPFDTLVNWHKRQQTLALVGNDPEAFRAAERERMLADPEFLAQAMERAKASAVGNGRATAPRVSLPSLANIPATGTGNVSQEPQSDGNLFQTITSARRK